MTSAEMTEMGLLQQAGAVAFTNGRHGLNDTQVLRRAMTYAREFGAVIALETREKYLAANGVMNEGCSPAGSASAVFRGKPNSFRSSATSGSRR